MPPNTIKIDRSTRWGNPFKVGEFALHPLTRKKLKVATKQQAIELFALHLKTPAGSEVAAAASRELRGRHLACWCKTEHGCHGDVLLNVANRSISGKLAA